MDNTERIAADDQKRLTRLATKKALLAGEISKPDACERCGAETALDCHHRNYRDHLDVEWLCPDCHSEHHASIRIRERQERAARAHELRAQGLKVREIAVEMGLSMSTVSDYLADPTGEKKRAQRKRYRAATKPCESCGEPTTRRWCRACIRAGVNTLWTRERIVEAIQECGRLIGGTPTASHFNPALARNLGHPDRAALHAACHWPQNWTIHQRFGSWNAALEAAGFQRRGGRTGRRAA